jgi:hypothetical protein
VDLGSRLAFGLSAVVLPGDVDPKLDMLKKSVIEKDQQLIEALRRRRMSPELKALEDRRDRIAKDMKDEASKPMPNEERLLDLGRQLDRTNALITTVGSTLDQPIAELEKSIRTMTLQIQNLNVHRSGAQLSVAGAWSWQVPNDVFGDSEAARAAYWVTPSYRARLIRKPKDESAADDADADAGANPRFFDVLGVARYVRNRSDGTSGADLGARIVLELTDVFSVSGEAVHRWWSAESIETSSYRAIGMVEARLGDKAYLFASFGRNFTEAETSRTLVTVVGLNIGFGSKPQLAIQ